MLRMALKDSYELRAMSYEGESGKYFIALRAELYGRDTVLSDL